jgi:hypothetical protein
MCFPRAATTENDWDWPKLRATSVIGWYVTAPPWTWVGSDEDVDGLRRGVGIVDGEAESSPPSAVSRRATHPPRVALSVGPNEVV